MLKEIVYTLNVEDLKKILIELPHFHWNELIYKDHLLTDENACEIKSLIQEYLKLNDRYEIEFIPYSQAYEFHSNTPCHVKLYREEGL